MYSDLLNFFTPKYELFTHYAIIIYVEFDIEELVTFIIIGNMD